jgi:hypothetical protein
MLLLDPRDHLGVDQAGLTLSIIPWSSWWATHGHPWRGRLGGGVDDDGSDWWSFPSLQHVPSRSVRVWSRGLQWRRRTSLVEPVAPTPSYSAARQGPTSLLTGWASPIRTRVKGPMGHWAYWWRYQSNIPPLISPYTFNCFFYSITDRV